MCGTNRSGFGEGPDYFVFGVIIINNNIEIYKARKVSELNLRRRQSPDG